MKAINKYMPLQLIISIILMLLFFKTKNIIFVLLSIIYILFKIKDNENKNGFKILLILYFIGLSYYLFFEPLFGRSGSFEFLNFKSLKVNLIPFKAIIDYLKALFNIPYANTMNYDTDALFLNLIGNFLCIAPLGLLLPLSFEKQKNKKNYLITTLIICILLELLQCFSMNGSFDIDDIILNYSGAVIVYFLSIKDLIPFIENILLEQKEKINYKTLIIKGITIFIVFILLLIGFKYRDNKELEYINSLDQLKFKYIGDYKEDYTELIYEDEYLEYYLNHYKKENVIIIIAGKEYSLKDYLEEKTPALSNCEKLIDNGLDITRKEKK